MHPTLRLLLVILLCGSSSIALAQNKNAPKPPAVPEQLLPQIVTHQAGVQMTMLAEHPTLVTPTGIDVDEQGRVWLIACHTHFRPEGYPGPEHDEVLVLDADGGNRRVFYNRTDATMHIKVGPDGWVYLAERDRILRVKDSDGDGVGDQEENVAVLDTVADYPHNGLSGMAWHPSGGLAFSLGENFGKDWTLTARDGSQVTGRGEGGVFFSNPDGTKLRRLARGFWNPFGLLVRSDGEIFAAENDPGSRPPCRLLQVVEGADYGFQWVYGSAPVHPFVAWNGELRGTLGMIHPCGEGPSAIVQLGGGVLIPSWSNHAIEHHPLTRKGAGYTSQRLELITGGEYFRPVDMAVGPKGNYYITDWVFSSYELHQRGRLWKLSIDPTAQWFQPAPEPMNEPAKLARQLRDGQSKLAMPELLQLASDQDPYLADAALTAIANQAQRLTPQALVDLPSKDRLWTLVALRRTNLNDEKWVRALWSDPDPAIRFEVLRWIADGVLTSFKSDVEKLLQSPDLDYTLFEAALATWNTLNGNPGAGVTDAEVLVTRILDPLTPTRIKSYALRLAPANDKRLEVKLMRELYAMNDHALSTEVVRTLSAMTNQVDAWEMLMEIVQSPDVQTDIKLDAIAGLGQSAIGKSRPEQAKLLLNLTSHDNFSIQLEALRSLRGSQLDNSTNVKFGSTDNNPQLAQAVEASFTNTGKWRQGRPEVADTAAWLKRLDSLPGQPDADAGRRIFHNSTIGQCANCHRHSGRGNVVGPDLTLVALQGDRQQLLRSILQPNRDVAPQYFATALELNDGSVFTGILLRSSSVDVYRDSVGNERVFQKSDVVQRKELKASLMPTGLVDQLTDYELRDLLAFLVRSKE